jgi:F-type H+-transporting ATPase subunit b
MFSSMMIQLPAAPVRHRAAAVSRSRVVAAARLMTIAFVLVVAVLAARVDAQTHGKNEKPESPAAGHAAPAAQDHGAPAASEHGEAGAEEHGSIWQTVAKLFNFAILVGVLVYYLKAPVAAYLAGRSTEIRQALVTAAETRATASADLAEVDRRLKSLPAELEALKAQGAEDVIAEKARIAQAAAVERDRLLDQTRREIGLRLRIARRELVDLAADLTVTSARARVTRSITPDDQIRLVDRYTAQLGQGTGGQGTGGQGTGWTANAPQGTRGKEAR